MLKKVLLMIAVMIFAFSCSKTPTDPNGSGTGNTGDGGIIDGGSGTTSPAAISDFLNKHTGRYYREISSTSGKSVNVRYKIENGNIYMIENETPTQVQGDSVLLNNKLQILTRDSYYPMNRVMYLYTFNNNEMKESIKNIFEKDPYSPIEGYEKVGNKVIGLGNYAGNYYNYYEEQPNQPKKSYTFLIDSEGYLYMYKESNSEGNIQITGITLNGNNLIIKFINKYTESGQTYTYNMEQSVIFKDTYLIIDYVKSDYGYENIEDYKKSDLFNNYIGTYSSTDGSTSVNVTADKATITGYNVYNESILLGNTMTIYIYNSSTKKYEEHKIVFNGDGTAAYTKPDGSTVDLKKQGV